MKFSLHYSIKYFKNNNKLFPKYFESFFFPVNEFFSERFPEKCSTFHSNSGHYKEEFECSFHSRKHWSCVLWIDCKCTIHVDWLCSKPFSCIGEGVRNV